MAAPFPEAAKDAMGALVLLLLVVVVRLIRGGDRARLVLGGGGGGGNELLSFRRSAVSPDGGADTKPGIDAVLSCGGFPPEDGGRGGGGGGGGMGGAPLMYLCRLLLQ